MLESKGAAIFLSKSDVNKRTLVRYLKAILDPGGLDCFSLTIFCFSVCIELTPNAFPSSSRLVSIHQNKLFSSKIELHNFKSKKFCSSVKYVAEFGPLTEFNVKGTELSFFVRESLDVYAAFLATVFIFVYSFYKLLRLGLYLGGRLISDPKVKSE